MVHGAVQHTRSLQRVYDNANVVTHSFLSKGSLCLFNCLEFILCNVIVYVQCQLAAPSRLLALFGTLPVQSFIITYKQLMSEH